MRLDKALFIDGYRQKLVSEDVVLRMSAVGSASFDVVSETEPVGVVIFDIRYTTGVFQSFFIGYVERANKRSVNHWRVFCREMVGALDLLCPISLRSCSMVDVLDEVSSMTALSFNQGQASYSSGIQPRFASSGNGLDVMANVARVFSVNDFIWQQQKDGKVYVGSWGDSEWMGRDVVLDEGYFVNQEGGGKASIPVVPSLRPGVVLNDRRVDQVRLMSNRMLITWKT